MKRIGLVVCAAVAMMSCQPQKPVEVYQPAAENALRAPAVPLMGLLILIISCLIEAFLMQVLP